MPRTYRGDRKTVLVSNGGVAVSAGATSFGVAASAITDFPAGSTSMTFEVLATGESITVTGGLGTTSWSGITRGANHTTAAIINDGSVLVEIDGANDLNNFLQRDETALPTSLLSTTTPSIDGTAAVGTSTKAARADHVHPANVSSIKKTGSSALTGDVTLTGGTNVTLTQSGQDISIAAAGGGSVSDATPSAVGVVEVDHAPSGAHPVALTTDGLSMPSGLLGTSGTKAAAGNDSRLSDTRTPTAGSVVDASVSNSAAIAESKLNLASDAPAGTASRRTLGTAATQAAAGNDSRLTNVASINKTGSSALTGAVTLTGGSNVTLTQSGQDISIAATGGSSTLAADTDVTITSPANDDVLTYETSSTKWKNKPAASGFADPETTAGDMIYRNAANATSRLPAGTVGQVLGYAGSPAVPTPQAGGMVQIASTLLGSTTASITFASIPGTYKHLLLLMQGRGSIASTGTNLQLQFNADTGANYDYQLIYSATGSVAGATGTAQTSIVLGDLAGNTAPTDGASEYTIHIQNYAGTTFQKGLTCGVCYRAGASATYSEHNVGDWRNTAAITQILLFPASGSFLTGTLATLYGLI